MFIIEGNIGAGKSTFLKLMAKKLPYLSVSLEPVNNWQKQIYGQSLLTNFYENSQRWAYTFETLTMMNRVQEHVTLQKQADPLTLVERSVYSGHYCFAHNSYAQGFLNAMEWRIYEQWFDWLVQKHCQPPTGFIYLRVDPKISYERIKKRNRHAEKTISLQYLKQIHNRHDSFLIQKNNVLDTLKKVPVLLLDCNTEFEYDEDKLNQHAESVQNFLNMTHTAHVHDTHIISCS